MKWLYKLLVTCVLLTILLSACVEGTTKSVRIIMAGSSTVPEAQGRWLKEHPDCTIIHSAIAAAQDGSGIVLQLGYTCEEEP